MAFPHFRIPKISSSMSRDGEVSKARAVGRMVAERNEERERERDDSVAAGAPVAMQWLFCYFISTHGDATVDVE